MYSWKPRASTPKCQIWILLISKPFKEKRMETELHAINTSKFQFDLERTDTFKRVHMNLCASWVIQSFWVETLLYKKLAHIQSIFQGQEKCH